MASFGASVSGSDSYREDQTRHCQPCGSDGDTVTAVGYCRDCKELLCQKCYDGHLIPSVTRKHKLIGLEEVGGEQQSCDANDNSITCPQHGDKKIKYHCPSHAFLGCSVCSFQHQKTCQDVKYIPDVANDIARTDRFKSFNHKLTGLTSQCQGLFGRITKCRKAVAESHAEAVAAFKAHKEKIMNELDKLEKQFIQKADEFKQEESKRIKALGDKLDGLLTENQRLSSSLELLQNQRRYCDLYTTMVESQDKLLDLEKDTRDTAHSLSEKKVVFKADMGVLEKLKQPFGLGSFDVCGESLPLQEPGQRIQKLEYIGDSNVRCSGDTTTCKITSSALISRNKLVLCDRNNNKVKLCDPSQNKVVPEVKVTSDPSGVCRISDNQAAVALYDAQKVALLRMEPRLAVEREISVNGRSSGVGYCDGQLVVSYDYPDKVEILDMQGKVLRVIEKDKQGQILFDGAYKLCVNPDSKLMYVSNANTGEVLCLRLDGTVVGRYKDSELSAPWQVIVDRGGTVYVCAYGSHNVHQVTGDCEKVRLLLTQADGLNHPESISYDEDDGKVYIGQYNNDNIKVYKVTCEDVK